MLVFNIPIKSTPMETAASAAFFDKNQLPNRKNPLLKLSSPYAPAPSSPPSISWYRRLWHPTPIDNGSTSSPTSSAGSQGRWWLLLQNRQPYWTTPQAVTDCRRYKTSEVIPSLKLYKIVLHSWTHPWPWDNLRLCLSMPRWINLSTTLPSATCLTPCPPPT